MKPGEYIGSDGRAHNVRSVMLDELDDACNSVTMQLNGGAWLTYKKHLLPSHPDFALAVAALQSLIRPSLDPRSGRVLAMREEGWEPGFVCSPDMPNEEVPLSPLRRMRFYRDGGWDLMAMRPSGTWAPTDECAPSIVLLAFEAGRRYERERG